MKNKIDLAKIKVRKLPTKWITANFDGTSRKYEIRALNDGERVNFIAMLSDSRNVNRVRNMYVSLLSCGLEIAPEAASVIYDNCATEAVRVGDLIMEFSNIFETAKTEEAAEAEKNFSGETTTAPATE